MIKKVNLFLVIILITVIAGCGEPKNTTIGVYMLIDTSGTYTKQLKKAQKIINYTLSKLRPNDTFAVARIDSNSFSDKDIISKVTFDQRPSISNKQKLMFKKTIDKFVKSVKGSSYTDITGGLMQAVEYLKEKKVGTKIVLIFSDLEEELSKGQIRDFTIEMPNVRVVALNVTKLSSDNIDPRKYYERLEIWKNKVIQGGGQFKVINDLERLDTILTE